MRRRKDCRPFRFGKSAGLLVGQKVLVIGNPFGYERTLTTGIISATGRSIQAENQRIIENVIQTDAAINPGNSGGPLLNRTGEIIGINSQIVSPSSGSAGIGFAIPVRHGQACCRRSDHLWIRSAALRRNRAGTAHGGLSSRPRATARHHSRTRASWLSRSIAEARLRWPAFAECLARFSIDWEFIL